ncbi:MAG: class I SAM-dependent methyltransferase [Anaerolineaceae bacterium]|nr:class I SAM-dependent methyltransferase [Anaerolineaceae bacterium]
MPDLTPDDIYRHEPMPQSQDEARARHESNRAAWNEGAAMYTAGIDEAIAFLKAGQSNLHPVERSYLAPLLPQVKTAIHLQCASGRDTLSLWNEGVPRVIGVDISDVHIANARQITAALNAPAEWYRCDLLDTPHELDGAADLVYTGRGAMCWINDLDGWAGVVTRLLKPGGYLSLFDDHPASWLFNLEAETYQYDNIDFFNHADSGLGWPSTYIGDQAGPLEQQSRKYECLWPIARIVQALLERGLVLRHLGEHPDPYWEVFPNLKPELRGKIPLTFSLLAQKERA